MDQINKHVYTWIGTFLFGVFGVNRFMRGQIVFGILKLLSCFIFVGFVWVLIDWVIALSKLGKYEKDFYFSCGSWDERGTKEAIEAKEAAIEELTSGKFDCSYADALKIKEALEAKGGKFSETLLHASWRDEYKAYKAEAMFSMSIPPSEKTCLRIFVTESSSVVNEHKKELLGMAKGCFFQSHTIIISSGEYGDGEDEFGDYYVSYDSNILEYMKLASSFLARYGKTEWYIEGKRVEAP